MIGVVSLKKFEKHVFDFFLNLKELKKHENQHDSFIQNRMVQLVRRIDPKRSLRGGTKRSLRA